MIGLARTLITLLAKDLLTELRTKQLLPTMLMLGLLLGCVLRLSSQSLPSQSCTFAAAAILIITLFAAVLSSERIFATESLNDCITALLLAPVDSTVLYFAKLLANLLLIVMFQIVAVPAVLIMFNLLSVVNWPYLLLTMLLIDLAVVSLGTLLGCATQSARTANSLLAVLILALLFPIIVPAVSALIFILAPAGQRSTIELFGFTGDFKTALGFIAAFDAIFITISAWLFGFVAVHRE